MGSDASSAPAQWQCPVYSSNVTHHVVSPSLTQNTQNGTSFAPVSTDTAFPLSSHITPEQNNHLPLSIVCSAIAAAANAWYDRAVSDSWLLNDQKVLLNALYYVPQSGLGCMAFSYPYKATILSFLFIILIYSTDVSLVKWRNGGESLCFYEPIVLGKCWETLGDKYIRFYLSSLISFFFFE